MFDKYLDNRLTTLYIIPFVIGVLTVFSFQPFNFTIINFFVLPILFYLIIYIKKKSKSVYRKKPYKINLFIFGTFFGFGFYLAGIHWITNSLSFDEKFRVFIPIGLILIPLFLSLFFSILIVILGPLISLNIPSIFLFSGGLAFSDYLRAKILTGFPWNLWAYSFSWNLEFIQILNKVGLFVFNLFSVTIFMLPAILFLKIKLIHKIIYILFIPLVCLSFFIYGSHTINQNQKFIKEHNNKFNIKLVSPNFELMYGLSFEEINKRLISLIRYSDPKENQKTLFVWPEGVFSGYNFEELFKLKEVFSKNFSKKHYILLGVNRLDKKGSGVYNSMIIVNNDLEILQEYKKQKLVPFGEFLPFEKILNKIGLKKITEGHGSFLNGKDQKNLKIDKLNVLPLICYEIIFTELIQKSNNDTNIIVSISEDGWFGNSIGPHQHFAKGIFRAIEKNSFLLRAVNKGFTAIINNKGEIIKKLNPSEAGNIELDVPLMKSEIKNKNDLIFFVVLITYVLVFYFYKRKYEK